MYRIDGDGNGDAACYVAPLNNSESADAKTVREAANQITDVSRLAILLNTPVVAIIALQGLHLHLLTNNTGFRDETKSSKNISLIEYIEYNE